MAQVLKFKIPDNYFLIKSCLDSLMASQTDDWAEQKYKDFNILGGTTKPIYCKGQILYKNCKLYINLCSFA